jgi:protein-tyrosine phosphatase
VRTPDKYSIDHRGYLLVEFSDFLIPKTTDQIFARLMRAGLRPIVTHPERNQLLQRRLPELEAWVAQGILIQVTALSFLGRFGRTAKRFADDLMVHGLVHFVASDAHDTRWRTTDMTEARRYVEKQYGNEAAERVFVENAQAVLAGVEISHLPVPIKRKRWFSW